MSSPGPTAPATWLGLFLCGVHPAGLPDSVTAQGPGRLGRGRGLLGLVPRVVSHGRVGAVCRCLGLVGFLLACLVLCCIVMRKRSIRGLAAVSRASAAAANAAISEGAVSAGVTVRRVTGPNGWGGA